MCKQVCKISPKMHLFLKGCGTKNYCFFLTQRFNKSLPFTLYLHNLNQALTLNNIACNAVLASILNFLKCNKAV